MSCSLTCARTLPMKGEKRKEGKRDDPNAVGLLSTRCSGCQTLKKKGKNEILLRLLANVGLSEIQRVGGGGKKKGGKTAHPSAIRSTSKPNVVEHQRKGKNRGKATQQLLGKKKRTISVSTLLSSQKKKGGRPRDRGKRVLVARSNRGKRGDQSSLVNPSYSREGVEFDRMALGERKGGRKGDN